MLPCETQRCCLTAGSKGAWIRLKDLQKGCRRAECADCRGWWHAPTHLPKGCQTPAAAAAAAARRRGRHPARPVAPPHSRRLLLPPPRSATAPQLPPVARQRRGAPPAARAAAPTAAPVAPKENRVPETMLASHFRCLRHAVTTFDHTHVHLSEILCTCVLVECAGLLFMTLSIPKGAGMLPAGPPWLRAAHSTPTMHVMHVLSSAG